MRLPEPVKFVLVGAGGYVVNLVAFAALVGAGAMYVAASIAAYFLSNALMYVGNRYFTFGLGHDGLLGAYARYTATGLVVAGLNAALLAGLVEGAGLPPTPGQALSLLLLTPVAFVLNRRWTFRVATP
jgi:putative flippase GtrA